MILANEMIDIMFDDIGTTTYRKTTYRKPHDVSSHVQCQQHRRLHARTLDQAVLKLTRIMCAVQHNQVTC